MRRSIYTLALICLAFSAQAQSAFDKATDKVCECLTAKTDAYVDANSLQMAMTECMQTAIMQDPYAIMQERNITDPTDVKAMTKLGEDINSKLLDDCPAHLDGMKVLQSSAMSGGSPKASGGVMIGTLKAISSDDLAVLSVVDETGTSHEIHWLSPFPGDKDLMNAQSRFLNQKVQVRFESKKIYLPKSKGYKEIKELRSISLAQK